MSTLTGGCYCRAVTYASDDPAPRPVIVCHCKQCRQFTGYTYAATAVLRETLEIEGADQISWFQSSATARRGFCQTCGSTLFWDQGDSPTLSIAAGSVDTEDQLKFGWHIYVDDQPPYYSLTDDCLKYAVDADGPTR